MLASTLPQPKQENQMVTWWAFVVLKPFPWLQFHVDILFITGAWFGHCWSWEEKVAWYKFDMRVHLFLGGMVAPTTDKFSRNPTTNWPNPPFQGLVLAWTIPRWTRRMFLVQLGGLIYITRVVTITNLWGNCANHVFFFWWGGGCIYTIRSILVYTCTVL